MDINKLCPHCMREIKGDMGASCPFCGHAFGRETEVQHQLRPFTILQGKYLVGDVLGEGGFGITYIGFDLNLEIRVAIKEFYPNGYATREANVTNELTAYAGQSMEVVYKWRDNFLKEARSLAKCAHLPGVVGVKDFFQENNTAYIVQEYLEGMTLKEYAKSLGGKIETNQLLAAIEPVLSALGEVHKEGLIHRDISPDNIMLLKSGQMKLLDFGAARDFTEGGEKSLSVLLKPGYAPEEQYRTKGNQGPWSDIYALAGTIYKCITGITPPEAMERMRQDELIRPSALGIAIEPNVEQALLKGMAVFAENRYQTMEEFHRDLYGRGQTSVLPGAPVSADMLQNQMSAKEQTVVQGAKSVSQTASRQSVPDRKTLPAGLEQLGPFVQKYKIQIAAILGIAAITIIIATAISSMSRRDKKEPAQTADTDNNSQIEVELQEETQEEPMQEQESESEIQEENVEVDMQTVLAAYQDYFDANYVEGNCSLIYLDEDEIPEYCYFSGDMTMGVLWYRNGEIIDWRAEVSSTENYAGSEIAYQEKGKRVRCQTYDSYGAVNAEVYEFSEESLEQPTLIGYENYDGSEEARGSYIEYLCSCGRFKYSVSSDRVIRER